MSVADGAIVLLCSLDVTSAILPVCSGLVYLLCTTWSQLQIGRAASVSSIKAGAMCSQQHPSSCFLACYDTITHPELQAITGVCLNPAEQGQRRREIPWEGEGAHGQVRSGLPVAGHDHAIVYITFLYA